MRARGDVSRLRACSESASAILPSLFDAKFLNAVLFDSLWESRAAGKIRRSFFIAFCAKNATRLFENIFGKEFFRDTLPCY